MEQPIQRMVHNSSSLTPLNPGIDTLGTSFHNNDHIAIISISVVIGLLGILGNSVVIMVFLMNQKLIRTLTNLFIFHQSFIDLVSSIVFISIRLDKWRPLLSSSIADITCRLWYSEYLLWVIVMTSTLNLLLVSLERYLSIAHPVFHRNHLTRKNAKLSMLMAWLISLGYQAYWAVVSTAADGKCEPQWIDGTAQTFFGILTFFVEYLIPLVLMTFAYASIISRLNKRCRVSTLNNTRAYTMGAVVTEIPGSSASSTPRLGRQTRIPPSHASTNARIYMFSKAKRNVAKTLCIVFATYVICWTPTELEYLVYNLGGPLDFNGSLHRVTVILVLCNMCVNPIIYALKYREFQTNFKQMICRLVSRLRRFRNSKSKGPEVQQFSLIQLSPLPSQLQRAHNQADNLAMSDQISV
ncbi:galanin receptor 2a-like [Asterias amurensis]|uniref:galanin receptor 2a-like n=1 Tax=Asterias amurensis TaxID=7602 RepID=UPI003AB2A65E